MYIAHIFTTNFKFVNFQCTSVSKLSNCEIKNLMNHKVLMRYLWLYFLLDGSADLLNCDVIDESLTKI